MKKFEIKTLRRKIKLFKKRDVNIEDIKYTNITKILCPIQSNVVWVSDFTYIKYLGRYIYLAIVQDLFTKEVLGVSISRYHNSEMVVSALQDAVNTASCKASYIHSDQGSEYRSMRYHVFTSKEGIQISMSDKGSPWQNGQMESFFGKFKEESGDLGRFESLPELMEYIYQQVYYYNHKRIHTKLKMCPSKFGEKSRRTLS